MVVAVAVMVVVAGLANNEPQPFAMCDLLHTEVYPARMRRRRVVSKISPVYPLLLRT